MHHLPRPSASYGLTIRVKIDSTPGSLGRVTSTISELGADIQSIDIQKVTKTHKVRDIIIQARDEKHGALIVEKLNSLGIVEVLSVSDRTLLLHTGGKIEMVSKVPLKTREDLSMAYTPGVARVCMAIHDDPEKAYKLTIKAHTIAVVSDGTAVLGLGDIGPEAAMPVMEGKALLFKEFGNVDALPGDEGHGGDHPHRQSTGADLRWDQS
jgi:malate dehydrogenase (oxaloacetate-decarboxylating)